MSFKSALSLSLILVLYAIGSPMWAAQKDSTATVRGYVYLPAKRSIDVNNRFYGQFGLPGAAVKLAQMKDGQLDSSYRVTSYDGAFSFTGIHPGKVYVKVSSVGFTSQDGIYDVTAGDNILLFTLKESNDTLKAATAIARAPLMKMLKDTTVFFAAATRSSEGESAMSIISQLPGFSVDDNGITFNGRKVARTYVNGIQMFGNNTMTAFDVLKASEVKEVRVYDEQSPEDKHLGLTHSLKDRVLDIRTKEGLLYLSDFGATVAGGADGARSGSGNLQGRYYDFIGGEYYSEMLDFSIMGCASNATEKRPSSSDASMMRLYNSSSLFSPSFSSYHEQLSAAAALNRYWKNRQYGNNVRFSYSYGRDYSKSASKTLTDYFATDDNPQMSYLDSLSSMSRNFTHNMMVSSELRGTKIQDIMLYAYASYSDDKTSSLDKELNSTAGNLTRSQHYHQKSDGDNFTFQPVIFWQDNRNIHFLPSISAQMNISSNSRLSWNTDTLSSSFLRRDLRSDGLGKGFDASMNAGANSYLVNSEKMVLSVNAFYNFQYRHSHSTQMSYDLLDPMSPSVDITNSYDYSWNTLDNNIGVGMSYSDSRIKMSVSLAAGRVTQIDDERYPSSLSYDRAYNRIIPSLNLRLREQNLIINCTASQPSLEQSRDRITDTNPLILIAGNPSLKQVYSTHITMNGDIWKDTKKGTYIGYFSNLNLDADRIVSRTSYFTTDTYLDAYGYTAKAGSMMYSYENAPGAWSASLQIPFSAMIRKAHVSITFAPSGTIECAPQYVRSDLLTLTTTDASVTASFMYRPSKSIRINGSPLLSMFRSHNSSGDCLSSGWRLSGRASIVYDSDKGFYSSANLVLLDNHYNSGAGINTNVTNLGIRIGQYFFKRALCVSLTANDLLSKGSDYTTTVTVNSYKQVWTPSYGRYFMLTLSYTFRKKS